MDITPYYKVIYQIKLKVIKKKAADKLYLVPIAFKPQKPMNNISKIFISSQFFSMRGQGGTCSTVGAPLMSPDYFGKKSDIGKKGAKRH